MRRATPLLLLAWLAIVPAPAHAATIAVTTTADQFDAGGPCSLREAIEAANTDTAGRGCTAGSGADTISLGAGTYSLSIPKTGGDTVNMSGDLDISSAITITGQGPSVTTVDGNGDATSAGVFDIRPAGSTSPVMLSGFTVTDGKGGRGSGIHIDNTSSSVTIDDLRVTLNRGGDAGAGIMIDGASHATIRDSSIDGNTTATNSGGGISVFTVGSLTIQRSTISDNSAGLYGGGLDVEASVDITISDSTFSGNSTDGYGGGILLYDDGGTLTLTNSTVANNSADEGGGGIWVRRFGATLTNVTIAGNTADADGGGSPGDGGGIALDPAEMGSVTMRNTIVAGNSDLSPAGNVHPDCSAPVSRPLTSQGHNLIRSVTGCSRTVLQTADLVSGQDPLLGALLDNGGPTPTMALGAGSPAIGAADPAAAPATDQRGLARSAPDVGAYERVLCGKVPVNRIGTAGADTILGTPLADGVLGFAGNDTISTFAGKDAVCSGGGGDVVRGGSNADVLRGGAGRDRLLGGKGSDTLVGNAGRDRLNGGRGRDRCRGGAGPDTQRSCER